MQTYYSNYSYSTSSKGIGSIFVFKPQLILGEVQCPFCHQQGIDETSIYSDGRNVKYRPRLLYGISENHLLGKGSKTNQIYCPHPFPEAIVSLVSDVFFKVDYGINGHL